VARRCAYVPLDMTMPPARLRQILDGAGIAAILSDAASRTLLEAGEHRVLELEALLDESDDEDVTLPIVSDADSAYVIFTSGSTGKPKGVEIGHRALSNFLLSMAQAPGFDARDRIVAVTTFSFDISGLELFLPLIVGGQTFIAGHTEVRTGYELVTRLKEEGATVLQATPSLWSMLLEAGFKVPKGFKILCGGEPLPRDLADKLLATGAEVWNLYGPTETTIWSSASRVRCERVCGARRPPRQYRPACADRRPASGAGRRQRRTVDWWRRPGKGLFQPPRSHQCRLHAGCHRRRCTAPALPHWRSCQAAADGSLRTSAVATSRSNCAASASRSRISRQPCARRLALPRPAVALHTVNDSPRLVGYIVEAAADKTDLERSRRMLPNNCRPIWCRACG